MDAFKTYYTTARAVPEDEEAVKLSKEWMESGGEA